MMTQTPTARWPIRELTARVALCLDGYRGAGNKRVRKVPDVRAMRWYASIGLLDKPVEFQGRTALYGPRHLVQVVAVKRCQEAGMSLAQIQAELAGAGDDRLRQLSGVSAEALDEIASAATETPLTTSDTGTKFWKVAASRSSAEPADPLSQADSTLSYGIPLASGITIMVNSQHPPSSADIQAVQAAAEPLLRVLTDRGLAQEGA